MKHKYDERPGGVVRTGIKFGAALAIAMSWTANHSIFWVLLHGLFGWFYVIYYLLAMGDWTWF